MDCSLCGRIRRRQIRRSAPGSDKTAHPVLDALVPPARLSTGDSLSGRTRRSISGRTRSDRRWSVVVVQAHDPLSPLTPSSAGALPTCTFTGRPRRGPRDRLPDTSLGGGGCGRRGASGNDLSPAEQRPRRPRDVRSVLVMAPVSGQCLGSDGGGHRRGRSACACGCGPWNEPKRHPHGPHAVWRD